ncbi:MAG: hypothetical protein GY910_00865 [bacterium]|nr:hypothetical protein [Deltaproteobacteria bacterium]MCP4903509.1 hypothetical protein [bacterium]
MRSDAIDQLLSTYLELPARVSWRGALADSTRGIFEGGRLELAGVALLALPFDRLVFEAERFQFIPGIPARISAAGPRIVVSIDQRQIDQWLVQSRAPFELKLTESAVEFRMDIAGLALGRAETELRVQRGWFVLCPKRAELLGFRSRLASLFRTYLPLPRLAPQTRLTGLEHVEGALRLEFSLDDFEEEITPGLIHRMQERFLPFAKIAGSKTDRDDP